MKKALLTTAAILSASLALSACGGDAGDDMAADTAAADDTAADTVIIDETDAAPTQTEEADTGSTLSIDNDGAAMDVNEPSMDANVDTDGNVEAEVGM